MERLQHELIQHVCHSQTIPFGMIASVSARDGTGQSMSLQMVAAMSLVVWRVEFASSRSGWAGGWSHGIDCENGDIDCVLWQGSFFPA